MHQYCYYIYYYTVHIYTTPDPDAVVGVASDYGAAGGAAVSALAIACAGP